MKVSRTNSSEKFTEKDSSNGKLVRGQEDEHFSIRKHLVLCTRST
jgi:hypothetical protein